MTKEEYRLYLKSEHWMIFKAKIYRLCNFCCWCGTKQNLNIHHLTYRNIGNEKLEDVIVLCKKHHFLFHDGATQSQKQMAINNMQIQIKKPITPYIPKKKLKKRKKKKIRLLLKEEKRLISKLGMPRYKNILKKMETIKHNEKQRQRNAQP